MLKLLALIRREILQEGRKPRTYVFRGVIAALLIVPIVAVMVQIESTADVITTEQYGEKLFDFISILQFVIILLLGPASSSAALALERQNRTFDSLRVSGVTIWEIALAKSIGAFINVLEKLLLCAPAFGIAILLGASFLTTFWPMAAFLLGLTFLTCSLGTFFGLILRNPLGATVAGYLTTAAYFVGGVFAADQVPKELQAVVSPLHGLLEAQEEGTFLRPLLTYVGLGVILALLSSPAHHLFQQTALAEAGRRSLKERRNSTLGSFPVFRYALRGSPIPYLLTVLLLLAVDLTAVIAEMRQSGADMSLASAILTSNEYQMWTFAPLLLLLHLIVLLKACQMIASERSQNTFEVLGTTPVTGAGYILPKFLAMLVYCLPAGLIVALRLSAAHLLGTVSVEAIPVRTLGFTLTTIYYACLGLCLSGWFQSVTRATVVGLIVYVLHASLCWCCLGTLNPFMASAMTFEKKGNVAAYAILGIGEVIYELVTALVAMILLISFFDRLIGRLPNTAVATRLRIGPQGLPVPPGPPSGPGLPYGTHGPFVGPAQGLPPDQTPGVGPGNVDLRIGPDPDPRTSAP